MPLLRAKAWYRGPDALRFRTHAKSTSVPPQAKNASRPAPFIVDIHRYEEESMDREILVTAV